MAPAAFQVFETVVELLEMVLLKMPSKDVLLAQRVNRSWLLTIANSIKIQRHLFFVPESGEALRYFDDQFAEQYHPDYLQQQSGPARLGTAEGQVRMNPMIGLLYEKLRLQTVQGKLRSQLPLGWRLADASWRRMLLTQPPIHEIVLTLSLPIGETRKYAWTSHGYFIYETEIMRLGGLVHHIDEIYKKIHRHCRGSSARGIYTRMLSESLWRKEGLNVPAEVLDYTTLFDSL